MGIARTVVGDAFMLHFLWRREEGEKEPRGREPDDEAPAQRSALHMANAPQSTVLGLSDPLPRPRVQYREDVTYYD